MSKIPSSFIDTDTDGKSSDSANPIAAHGNQDGTGVGSWVDGGYDSIEPRAEQFTTPGPADTGSGPRLTKRGTIDGRTRRARTSSSITTEAPRSNSIERLSIAEMLLSIHNMGALILEVQEISIDDADAKKLADAIQEVGKHYATSFDPKKVAIVNLMAVSGSIYVPRILAYKMRKDSERGALPAPTPKLVPTPAKQTAATRVNGAAEKTRPISQMSPAEFWPEGADSTQI